MPGNTPTQTTQQFQSAQTGPWAPATPLLGSILQQLGQYKSGVTGPQQTAANTLLSGAGGVPQLGPQGTGAITGALGTSTAPQAGILNSAYGTLQSQLSPYTNAGYLNPYTNPALSSAIAPLKQDITNQVNSQFAAAGRDLSPGNSQALARGLSFGLGGLLTNQYNQNVAAQQGAIGQQFGGGTTTAGGLTQQQLAQIQGQLAGLQGAGLLSGLYTQPGATQLGAANTAAQLPLSNLAALEGLTVPIGALGSTSMGQSYGTVTNPTPYAGLGAGIGGLGLLGNLGAFGSGGWLTGGSGLLSGLGSGIAGLAGLAA